MVEEITSVKLLRGAKEVEGNKLALEDNDVTLEVKGIVKGEKEAKKLTLSQLDIKADPSSIVTIDDDMGVTPNLKGETKITIASKSDKTVKEEITVKVGEARKANAEKSEIAEKEVKVATGETKEVEVTVRDQYGAPMEGVAVNVGTESAITDEDGKTKVKVTGATEAGTVEVEAVESGSGVVLGKIKVITQEAGEAVGYEISADKEELDIFVDENKTAQVTAITVDEKGLKVDVATIGGADGNLFLKSTNEKVATVDASGNVKALAEGETTIEAYLVEGDLKDKKVDEIKITVIDSKPELDKAEIVYDKGTVKIAEVDDKYEHTIALKDLANVTAKNKQGEVEVEASVSGEDLVYKAGKVTVAKLSAESNNYELEAKFDNDNLVITYTIDDGTRAAKEEVIKAEIKLVLEDADDTFKDEKTIDVEITIPATAEK